ncbi:Helix-turn-helix [uncultured Clostridium sp.]|nr:Helix-turn-helix [uncultured Clostridium sp.]
MKKNILKSERVKQELTQKQVADKLGLSTGAYCDKENGKRKFTVREALLLEDIFSFNIREIFLTD